MMNKTIFRSSQNNKAINLFFIKKHINMKRIGLITTIVLAVTMLSSCEVIGGIFKAGVWSGIIIVVIVISLIIWLISKFMGGNRS